MSKHRVGKWARREVTELGQKKVRPAPKGNALHRGKSLFWCFLCNAEHRRADCPQMEEVAK